LLSFATMKTTHSRAIIHQVRRNYAFQCCSSQWLLHPCYQPFCSHQSLLPFFCHNSFVPHHVPSHTLLLCHFLALKGSDNIASTSFTSDNFPVVIDSGCTIAATGDINDFKPSSYTATQNVTLRGISAGLSVAGIGYLNWAFHDHKNEPVMLCLHAIHVPGLHVQLLPPQQIVSTTSSDNSNSYIGGSSGLTLIYNKHHILFSYDPQTNLVWVCNYVSLTLTL